LHWLWGAQISTDVSERVWQWHGLSTQPSRSGFKKLFIRAACLTTICCLFSIKSHTWSCMPTFVIMSPVDDNCRPGLHQGSRNILMAQSNSRMEPNPAQIFLTCTANGISMREAEGNWYRRATVVLITLNIGTASILPSGAHNARLIASGDAFNAAP